MIAIVEIRYRNDTLIPYVGVVFPFIGLLSLSRSLSFLFLHDFEGTANISVAIKSGSTVVTYGSYPEDTRL